jgi:hypothetical protein
MYAIQYATWLYNVELMARTSTAGSEATAIVPVRTPCCQTMSKMTLVLSIILLVALNQKTLAEFVQLAVKNLMLKEK